MKLNSVLNIVIILAAASFGISAAFADGPNGSASAGSNSSVADHFFMTDSDAAGVVTVVPSAIVTVLGGIGTLGTLADPTGLERNDIITNEIKTDVPSDAQLREIISRARNRETLSDEGGGKIRVSMSKTLQVGDERTLDRHLGSHVIDLNQSDEAVLRDLRTALEEGADQGMTFAKVGYIANISADRTIARRILAVGLVGFAWDVGHFSLQAAHYHNLSSTQCGPAVHCDGADKLVSSNQASAGESSVPGPVRTPESALSPQ